MILFRSLTLGLLGTCVLLLANLLARSPVLPRPARLPVPASVALPLLEGVPTIIDVSPAIRAADLPSLVPLANGEHVLAVGDRSVLSDLSAGAEIARSGLTRGQYLDLTVGNGVTTRRVLVLMH